MKNKTYILACFVILVASFYLRLASIGIGPYHADCLFLALQSQKIVDTHQMHYLQSSGLPLTAVAGAFFIWLLKGMSIHDPVIAVNFMSVFFSSLSVIPLVLLVQTLFDRKTAIMSAIVFVFQPLLFSLSTFGNSHILSVFYLLWSMYFISIYPRHFKWPILLGAGLSLGCLGASRLQDLGVMLPAVVMLMLVHVQYFKYKDSKKGWMVSNLVSYLTIPFVICGVVLMAAYFQKFFVSSHGSSQSTIDGFVRSNLTNYIIGATWVGFRNISMALFGFLSVPERIIMAAGALFCIFQDRARYLVVFLVWIFVPVALYGSLIFFVYRFLVVSMIPLVILCGYGLASFERRGRKPFYLVICIVLVGMIMNMGRYYPAVQFRHEHNLLPEFFEWVGSVTEDNAYIFERDNSLFIEHYAKRKPLGVRKNVDLLTADEYQVLKAYLDSLLDTSTPVYITRTRLMNRTDKFRQFMMNNYQLAFVGRRLIEDWHIGTLQHVVVDNDLIQIKRKVK